MSDDDDPYSYGLDPESSGCGTGFAVMMLMIVVAFGLCAGICATQLP